ncbi:MAG TPA: hypothetical protein VGP25_01030 [Gemmatimonadaceae bacterium]|nr:hypothetical protein [Gemmatimonadaceae bacterium]
MRRTVVFRGWAVLWAVLQFALSSVLTFADARLERESARAPGAHIEETAGATCRPSHPDECALCQFLSRAAMPTQSASLPAIAEQLRACAQPPIHGVATGTRARVSLPRAPPPTLA